jgi:serine/threonine protein phosphatase PrpC
VANIGETKAILVGTDGVERITIDHRATDPKEILRIE